MAEAGKMVSPALMALATSCWAACCRSSRPMRLSSSFIRATAFWADMPPWPMAAYSSSREPKRTFLSKLSNTSEEAVMADILSPACFSSASKEARPWAMFSSLRSFLNH